MDDNIPETLFHDSGMSIMQHKRSGFAKMQIFLSVLIHICYCITFFIWPSLLRIIRSPLEQSVVILPSMR